MGSNHEWELQIQILFQLQNRNTIFFIVFEIQNTSQVFQIQLQILKI